MVFVKPAPGTTSSAMDIASPAPSTPSSTPTQETATATMASTPTSSASAAGNAELTSFTTPTLISVSASRVLAEFLANAPSAPLELRPLLTAQAAPTVAPMRSFKAENVSARPDMPTTPPRSAHPAVKSPTVS